MSGIWLNILFKVLEFGKFPGCLVVRIQAFTARAQVLSLVGKQILQAEQCGERKKGI